MAIQFVGRSSGSTTPVSLTALTGGIDTAARQNDLVVYLLSFGSTADVDLSVTTSGYTEIADLYANDTYDANISVGYKFMGATPDTDIARPAGTGYALIAHVWRGVHSTNPMDVTPTTRTTIDTGVPTPPAITPTTAGAVVICLAGNALLSGPAGYTSSQLSNFVSQTATGTRATAAGVGSFAWTSGTFTPTAWGGGSTNSGSSYAAVSLALRPAPNPIIDIAATDNINMTSASSLTRVAGMGGTANISLGFDAAFVDVVQIAATATAAVSSTSAMLLVEQVAAAGNISLTATASMVTIGIVTFSAAADISLTGSTNAERVRGIGATTTIDLAGTATLGAVSSVSATDTITLTGSATMTLLWEPGSITSEAWALQTPQNEDWTAQIAQTKTWS